MYVFLVVGRNILAQTSPDAAVGGATDEPYICTGRGNRSRSHRSVSVAENSWGCPTLYNLNFDGDASRRMVTTLLCVAWTSG